MDCKRIDTCAKKQPGRRENGLDRWVQGTRRAHRKRIVEATDAFAFAWLPLTSSHRIWCVNGSRSFH